MMYTKPDDWLPSTNINLEPHATTVVRSTENYLVIAGPGAGKTELLAQRANYLLVTNTCRAPHRILAISFKGDAADNLRARVVSRLCPELAHRFSSQTFDSFARSILERFREGLPQQLRPPRNFEPITDFHSFTNSDIRPLLKSNGYSFDAEWMLKNLMCSIPVSSLETPGISEKYEAARFLWERLIKRQPCMLSFDMIKRLAQHILEKNPLVTQALRATYSHVFLDEFQDTTCIQFDLLKTAFHPNQSIMTAVGDNKQRIMVWAGAMLDAFEAFENDYQAKSTHLLVNRRSDKILVEIQQHLINAIDPSCQPPSPAPDKMDGDGRCEILVFHNEVDEADRLLTMVKDLISDGVNLEDICVLFRQTASKYIHCLLNTFNSAGVPLRLEEPYQELLKDEFVQLIISVLYLCEGTNPADYWIPVIDLVYIFEGVNNTESKSAFQVENRLSSFINNMKPKMSSGVVAESDIQAIVDDILSFLGRSRLRARFPNVQNTSSFKRLILNLVKMLYNSWSGKDTWKDALDSFRGCNIIPAMSIHKSKGLEYHTVFFIGLEDNAWWNFAKQSDEETRAFFVAFSRAKKQVYFTFCENRSLGAGIKSTAQQRSKVNSLYQLLQGANVQVIGYR